MESPVPFDREKFRELVLYVARESEDDVHFGATKLNKILYFSDFKAFAIAGSAITGAAYQRLDRGPAPRPIVPLLREMEREGEIERTERRYFNLLQKRVVALRDPDLSDFTEQELEIVSRVIEELQLLNASQVSALSHLETGWQVARPGETIPYHSAYISDRRPTQRELDKRGIVAAHGHGSD